MNVEEYLRQITPRNVVELLPQPAFKHLLNGFSSALGAGIALVYPTRSPITREDLKRLDGEYNRGRRATFHDLCRCWRDPDKCGQDQTCFDADDDVAMMYFNRSWLGPRVYRCTPLCLWDMTYPLTADERVIGVLFGGQLAVDGEINWRSALSKFVERVDWVNCPAQDNQLETIRARIASYSISRPGAQELLQILDAPSDHERTIVSVEDFKLRIEEFFEFGRMTQELLDELNRSRKRFMAREIERYFDQELDRVELSREDKWWEGCRSLLEEIKALFGINDVCPYVLQGSSYFSKALRDSTVTAPSGIEARIVISSQFPPNKLAPMEIKGNGNREWVEGTGPADIWGYRSWTGEGREVCSTLVVFLGQPRPADKELIEDLGGQICAAADFAQLLFRERKVDVDYRREVRLIGHSFRTPLQALQFLLERIVAAPAVADSPILLAKAQDGLGRILDARQDLFLLLEPPIEQQEKVFNLANVLRYVIKSMEPIAEKHPCCIVSSGVSRRVYAPVRGIRYRVERALIALLDNAIKYSYFGERKDTGGLYEVRVRLEVADGYAKITMKNYGIGFPADKIAVLSEYGVRGEIKDHRLARLGSGLGLPFAIEVFEECGGRILVSSVPAPSATDIERATYHRYITIVEAILPIARRS